MECGHNASDFYVHDCPAGRSAPQGVVHALVIGTSKYRYKHRGAALYETFDDVPGAALGAGKFARFIRDQFRDPIGREVATVRLLLAPTDDEATKLKNLGATWQPANYSNVRRAVKAWFDDCDTSPDNINILYAAGHGLIKTNSFAHVFLQAAEGENEPNAFYFSLNITGILDSLYYNYSRTKLIITDCCAQPFYPPDLQSGIVPDLRYDRMGKFALLPPAPQPLHIAAAPIGANGYALGASEGTLLSWVLERLLNSAGELKRHPLRPNEQYFVITQPRMTDLVYSVFRSHKKAMNLPSGGPAIFGQTASSGLHQPTPPPEFLVEFVLTQGENTDPVNVTITKMDGSTLKTGSVSSGKALTVNLPAGQYKRQVQSRPAEEFSIDQPRRFDALSGKLL